MLREDVANTLRVLVATDIHLGYMEKDEVRRHDSFQAFEEICSIAQKEQVILKFFCQISERPQSYLPHLYHAW